MDETELDEDELDETKLDEVNSDEFVQSIKTEQVDDNSSILPLTPFNIKLINKSIEPEIISNAKTKLIRSLVSALTYKISNGYKEVCWTDSLFEILNGYSRIYDYIRTIASGENYDEGIKLLQYKYNNTIINIVMDYSFGSFFEEQVNKIEAEIYNASNEVVLNELEQDLREKFNSLKFFLDFNEAISYTINFGKRWNINIKFVQNPEKTKQKKEQKIQRKEYVHSKPTKITFGDFIPIKFKLSK